MLTRQHKLKFQKDKNKKDLNQSSLYILIKNGGSGEIRTHGGLSTLDGFQDRCIKPLCHASVLEAVILMELTAFAKRYFRKNI
jgi:hypothetical protein